jgi:hypothetical protein
MIRTAGLTNHLEHGIADMKVWNKTRPKSLGKPEPLSSAQKSSAKSAAKKAGRPYPNLIDNMRAATKKPAAKKP